MRNRNVSFPRPLSLEAASGLLQLRKVVRSGATALSYERKVQPLPKLGQWRADLDRLLLTNSEKPSRERLTLMRIFEALRGLGYAKVHPHPEFRDRTVWQTFEAELPSLVPYAGRFDGFHPVLASVSESCLVRFDNNRYLVAASAIGRPVEVRAYADRIEVRQEGRVMGDHPRAFGRDQTVFDPWDYVPVLARKPGALRNGAPFKNWVLPAGLDRVRRKLAGADRSLAPDLELAAALQRGRGSPAIFPFPPGS